MLPVQPEGARSLTCPGEGEARGWGTGADGREGLWANLLLPFPPYSSPTRVFLVPKVLSALQEKR